MAATRRQGNIDSLIRTEILRLQGPERDQAWFTLLEVPDSALPELVEAYQSERDAELRAAIVEAIWQRGNPAAFGFLGKA